VRVTRLRLANFRVFPELDVELPPGIVGIYGPNGSGKSTLVEAILWALFGVARASKDSLRSDGATAECRASVEFEHDGHLYEVTRAIAGAANGVRAEAACDGQRLAAGALSVRQYVHQVLGLSAEAFRASVFCEQKQLDAFSGRRPEERRRLVLDLLGITPLDRARDAARSRARVALESVEAARLVLGDLDSLAAEAIALEAELEATVALRAGAEEALARAEAAERQAEEEAIAAEARKAERDRLATAFREAERRRGDTQARLEAWQREREALAEAGARLPALEAEVARLGPARRRLAGLEALEAARARLAQAEAGSAPAEAGPPLTDLEGEAGAAERAAGEAAGRVAGLEAAGHAAQQRRQAAAAEAERADRLDPDAPCPLCGQELGACFEEVQAQRQRSLGEAAAASSAAEAELVAAREQLAGAEARAERAAASLKAARADEARHAAARAELAAARSQAAEAKATLDPAPYPDELAGLRLELAALEAARDDAVRLRERLARAADLDEAIAAEHGRLAEAEAEAARLLEAGRAVAFDPAAHAAALSERRAARETMAGVRAALVEAQLNERGLGERLGERRARLDAELARREELAAREDDALHLGRLAELLGEFRNSLVGQVGPALSAQTSALFRELTDGRFDSLEVDPDSFELRVGVGGAGHPLDRHSGSETDLANLSLRVAIGEQVNLLSGGQVGLLVLDEVLGSLDGEHRDRLLGALTRLAARFRQVLVVTHAAEVKEQLPAALEVVPLARGRSEAHLAGSLQPFAIVP
jgi:exonuclease SbcC